MAGQRAAHRGDIGDLGGGIHPGEASGAGTVRPMAGAASVDPTRAALLGAAHDLLAEHGPGALTVRRLAGAAGVSTMNVYSRFGGKDGVLDELFADGFTRLSEALEAAPSTTDPLADLLAAGRAYLAFARRWPTYYSLMFERVVPEYVPSPAARAVANATFEHLVGSVERAIAAGVVAPGDASATAAGLWAHVHGLASLAVITRRVGGPAHLADRDWESIADAALVTHVSGLARVGAEHP